MIIVVTASNNIYALNADTGAVIWQRTDIGPAVTSGLPCGNINPAGTIGTPVVDLASRSLFFDALIAGTPIKHFIFSLNVDTGATNAGWPVDLDATASTTEFPSFPWFKKTGRTGSCERDRVRFIFRILRGLRQLPWLGCWCATLTILRMCDGWATTALGGGIWGHSGVASDGTNMFVITGNTFNTGGNWMGGEAIIRLQAGPSLPVSPPTTGRLPIGSQLDNRDTDLGGVSAMLIDVPGATPSQLVLALGKMATPICLIAIILVVSRHRWPS